MGKAHAPFYLGIISSFSTSSMGITAFFSGWLSDRIKNRKLLIETGYVVEGVLVGLLSVATNWIQVLVGCTLAWSGRGVIGSTRSALIAESTNPAYYGHAFGFRQAMDTIGSIMGPLIVYFLSTWPARSLFIITLIPATLAWLTILFFIQETPPEQKLPLEIKSSVSLPTHFKVVITALFVFALGNFSKTLLIMFSQSLLFPTYGPAGALSITTLLYVFRNLIQTGATYFMGALSDRMGRKIPLAIGGFLFFGIMNILLLFAIPNILYLIIIFFFSGFSAGTSTSLEKSLAADILPHALRGTGYGLLLIVQSIGALIASMVVGFLWTAVSAQASFIYAAFLSLCAAVILLVIPE